VIYHITTEENLLRIRDGLFRARRWNENCPHAALRAAVEISPHPISVFRMCFWRDEEQAFRLMRNTFDTTPAYMLRYDGDIDEIVSLGFQDSWDDMFPDGEVYLFWLSEPRTTACFSRVGIPLEQFSVHSGDQWHPLPAFLKERCKQRTRERAESRLLAMAVMPSPPPSLWQRIKQFFG